MARDTDITDPDRTLITVAARIGTATTAAGNDKSPERSSGLFHARFCGGCAKQALKPAAGKSMAKEDKKTKDAAPKKDAAKKEPAAESKGTEAATKTESGKTDGAKDGAKTEVAKAEGVTTEVATTDAAPARKGMGEGQKPVTQAYKDNWNAIFGNKAKKKR
jgi:hypothetical protein